MRRRPARLTAAVLTIATIALAACGGSQHPDGGDSARAGKVGGGAKAPDFSVDTLSGDTFRLSSHQGKDVVVIDFWTTFCQPCIGALHHLEALYQKHKGKGLVVLGVSMDPPETAGQVVPFTRSHGLSFPVAHDLQSRVTELYNKKSSAPYQVLISRDGRILKIRESYQPGDEAGMEADIVEALSQ